MGTFSSFCVYHVVIITYACNRKTNAMTKVKICEICKISGMLLIVCIKIVSINAAQMNMMALKMYLFLCLSRFEHQLSWVLVVLGTNRPGYELSWVQVDLGMSWLRFESYWVRVGLDTSCLGYEMSIIPKPFSWWTMEVVLGTSRLEYELSWVQVVLGMSWPGYELSWVRVVHNPSLANPCLIVYPSRRACEGRAW